MQENTFKNIYSENFNVKKYWRNIDKQILAGFTLLFILGIFFSFSSTSILADERLDREYYSFFQKHFSDNLSLYKDQQHMASLELPEPLLQQSSPYDY